MNHSPYQTEAAFCTTTAFTPTQSISRSLYHHDSCCKISGYHNCTQTYTHSLVLIPVKQVLFLSRKPQSQVWTHLPGFSGRHCSLPRALLNSGKTGGSTCWSCSLDRPHASHLSLSEKIFYLGERSLTSDDYCCSVQHHEFID